MALKITKDFGGVLFAPKKSEVYPGCGVLYPRVIELQHSGSENGTLLAAFEYYEKKEPAAIPIYKSVDGGKTWEHFSDVHDIKTDRGLRYQPFLFELPMQCGDLSAGTILFSGNSIPKKAFEKNNPHDFPGTELQLYVSRDSGKSWEFRSSFAYGGMPIVEGPHEYFGPVWEPFIYINSYNELTIIFSDEKFHTNGIYNQVLALVTSSDGGKTWSDEKLIVAIPDGIRRPGMAVVTKLPNGKFFMCYEIVNDVDEGIYFRISDDGLDFGDPTSYGTRAETSDGKFVGSMPYCLWTKNGGPNGTIILSGKRDSGTLGMREHGKFMVNYKLGEGSWERADMLVSYDARIAQTGWSMGMATIENDTKLIQFAPTQMDTKLLQISFGIADMETV